MSQSCPVCTLSSIPHISYPRGGWLGWAVGLCLVWFTWFAVLWRSKIDTFPEIKSSKEPTSYIRLHFTYALWEVYYIHCLYMWNRQLNQLPYYLTFTSMDWNYWIMTFMNKSPIPNECIFLTYKLSMYENQKYRWTCKGLPLLSRL